MNNELYRAFDDAMSALERLESKASQETSLAVSKSIHSIYVSLDTVRDKLIGNIA